MNLSSKSLHDQLQRFRSNDPDVSVIIPAYNEEKTLIRLLESMAAQKTRYRVELIVVNNNSTDQTQAILDQYGVRSILVREQGVAYARQAGLLAARGRFVANADADTIYPPTWLDALVDPLHNPAISCTYGTYSFIPAPGTSAAVLALYERAARLAGLLRRNYSEYINVLGFNFAFRREDALTVGGFNLDTGHQGAQRQASKRCEDGWMALCLMDLGNLHRVGSVRARARTSDRRLMIDGGPQRIFVRRLWREWKRFSSGSQAPVPETVPALVEPVELVAQLPNDVICLAGETSL